MPKATKAPTIGDTRIATSPCDRVGASPSGAVVSEAWLQKILHHDGDIDANSASARELAEPLGRLEPTAMEGRPVEARLVRELAERGRFYSRISANLDLDPESEHLLLFSIYSAHDHLLMVLDRHRDGWVVAQSCIAGRAYQAHAVAVLDARGPLHPYCVYRTVGRGTGYYHDVRQCFMLFDGRPRLVLQALESWHIHNDSWDEMAHTHLEFTGAGRGAFTIHYSFIHAPVDGPHVAWDGSVRYRWNDAAQRFLPVLEE